MNNIDVNKLDMQSKDIVNDNVDKIFKLFPNCIREGKIDFDIDSFPLVPPFLEIDIEHITEEGYTVENLLKKLGLENNIVVEMGTEDIHKLYHIGYFEAYQVVEEKKSVK